MTDSSRQNEAERLAALHSYEILDTPPDGTFDRITALAARHFNVPVALVSLVDEDRIWFKSRHGLEAEQIPRSPGLCASVIFSDEAYVVLNAIEDPRTLANPLVAGEMGVRFYAAVPLVTHDGHRLGTMNIIDFKPRELGAEGLSDLHEFAGLVMDQMELRLSARKTIASLSQVFQGAARAPDFEKLVTVCAWSRKIKVDERWVTRYPQGRADLNYVPEHQAAAASGAHTNRSGAARRRAAVRPQDQRLQRSVPRKPGRVRRRGSRRRVRWFPPVALTSWYSRLPQ